MVLIPSDQLVPGICPLSHGNSGIYPPTLARMSVHPANQKTPSSTQQTQLKVLPLRGSPAWGNMGASPSVPRSVLQALGLKCPAEMNKQERQLPGSGCGPAGHLLCGLCGQDRGVWRVAADGAHPARPSWATSAWQELLPRQGGVHAAGQWRDAHAGGRGGARPVPQR